MVHGPVSYCGWFRFETTQAVICRVMGHHRVSSGWFSFEMPGTVICVQFLIAGGFVPIPSKQQQPAAQRAFSKSDSCMASSA